LEDSRHLAQSIPFLELPVLLAPFGRQLHLQPEVVVVVVVLLLARVAAALSADRVATGQEIAQAAPASVGAVVCVQAAAQSASSVDRLVIGHAIVQAQMEVDPFRVAARQGLGFLELLVAA
jgi:hypothetical protein